MKHKPRGAFRWIGLLLTLALVIPLVSCGGQGGTIATPTPTPTPTPETSALTGTISSPTGEVLVQKQGSETWIEAVSGMKLEVF